jgi:hypothetical protein
VVACPGRSSASWSIAALKPAGAKKLGVAVETTADGPLTGFSRVERRVGTGDNPPVTAPRREDRSKPDELAVWVRIPGLDGGSTYGRRTSSPPRR